MKKILLIALLLIPFFGFSQTTKPIEGFLGIKFGSSKADVLAAIQAKGGKLLRDTTDELLFENVQLGSLSPRVLFVLFVNNKAYQGQFVFKADVDDKTIDEYDNIVARLNDVYGEGKSEKTFRSTFKDGDGYEITAIEEGDADYRTTWRDKTSNNVIQTSISEKLYVYIYYEDSALNKEHLDKQKEKNKGDF